MAAFIHKRFLLQSAKAVEFYESYAAELPIVDYHCHLDPGLVASNHVYDNIVDLWIAIDPYKWRGMRMNGIEERLITGDASPEEKFNAFANTLPYMAGSPVFHWSALELKYYFGIDELLNPSTADEIYRECNRQIQAGSFGVADLLTKSNLETVCTSDGWLTDLKPHRSTQQSDTSFSMRPSLRGDNALMVDSPHYPSWLKEIGVRAGTEVDSLNSLENCLITLIDEFSEAGCTLSDHNLEAVEFYPISRAQAEKAFAHLLEGKPLSDRDSCGLKYHLLAFLVGEYGKRKWTLQLHLGAHRETSTSLMRRVRTLGGFACVGDSISSVALSRLLDYLETRVGLPRIILYPLNIADFEKMASLCGAFVEEGLWGKVQLGPPWWYNDHYEGIVHQLKVFANYGLLGRFVGMATDTRSPLSMARFDYFRRIFCNLMGSWVEDGVLPDDASLNEPLVTNVCYGNAVDIVGSVPVARSLTN